MQVNKTIIVISAMVDSTIKEYQPDVEFMIFHNLSDLGNYIQTTPIRADTLYITKDVFPLSAVNSNLTYLLGMLDNPFLAVNKVVYITEKDSQELVSVNYIIEERGAPNWKVLTGALNREYITNVINGTMDSDDWEPQKKTVYRMAKEAYYREKREEKQSLSEHYESDDEFLSGVPDVEQSIDILPEHESQCTVKHIVGLDSLERTALAFMCAQYLSLSGKTVILEKDFDYHTLTDMVTKSDVDYELVLVEDLLSNAQKSIEVIRKSQKRLVVVGSIERITYSYSFLVNILVNNLMDDIAYFVEEDGFEDIPEDIKYTMSIPCRCTDILRTAEMIDRNYVDKATFVGVNLNALPEISVRGSETLSLILQDVLDLNNITATVINITSLHLKGDTYDLNSIF